jgi:hypothetical protein
MRPVKVELVGLFPTLFSTRCKAVCDPAGLAGVVDAEAQLKEYPEEVLDSLRLVREAALSLLKEGGVEVRVVDALSPRGLWLQLRHRLRSGPWAIVEGRQKFALGRGTGQLLEGVRRAKLRKLFEQGLEAPQPIACGC